MLGEGCAHSFTPLLATPRYAGRLCGVCLKLVTCKILTLRVSTIGKQRVGRLPKSFDGGARGLLVVAGLRCPGPKMSVEIDDHAVLSATCRR